MGKSVRSPCPWVLFLTLKTYTFDGARLEVPCHARAVSVRTRPWQEGYTGAIRYFEALFSVFPWEFR